MGGGVDAVIAARAVREPVMVVTTARTPDGFVERGAAAPVRAKELHATEAHPRFHLSGRVGARAR